MNNSAIKNLADGTLSATSTEAVTGRQLNATNTNITNLQNSIKSISSSASLVQQSAAGKDITVAKDLDGDAVDFSGKKLSDSTTFSRKLTGVAEGTLSATSTDAVSGKQLYTTNQNLSTTNQNLADTNKSLAETNKNVSATTTNITNLQNTVNNISSGSVGLVQQSAAGKDITVAKDLDGDAVDFSGKKLSDSTTFSRKLTGVAEGALSATSTDAVSGKQLYTTNQNLSTTNQNLADTNKSLAETNKNVSATTTNITNLQNTVNNISSGSVGLVQQSAAGKDITVAKDLDGDAVDFSGKKLSDSTTFSRKLTGVAEGALSATSTDAVSGKQLYTTNQNLSTTNQNLADTNKSLAETNKNVSATTTNITNLQNTVNNISSGSVGLVQQSAAGKDITVAKDLDGEAVDFSGKKLSDSTTFSRKLTGVAEGTLSATSTDAVSGKQLYTTNQNLSTTNQNLADTNKSLAETNKNVSATTTNITNLQNTIKNISSGSAGLVQQSAAGKDITVAKDLDGEAVDFSGKKLSDSTTFSRKLTGVAEGTLSATSTDAVSGKQLYATNQNLADTNKSLAETNKNVSTTTTNITNLQNTIKNISSGSAGLVQQSVAGKDITVAKDLDGEAVDFSGKKLSDSTTFSRKLTGVAEGTLSATSTDAVSGKQLYATNQNLADTNKSLAETNKNVSATTTNITNLQNTIKNISGGSAGLVQQSVAGKDITVAKDLDGDAVDFSGKKLSDSTTFSRKLTGVAEGALSATSTDAVSGKQLYATNQNLASTNKDLANTNTRLTTAEGNLSSNTTSITNLQNTIKNISSGSAGLVQQSAAGKDITVAKDLDGEAVDFSGKKLSDSTTFSRKLTGVAEGTLSATSTDAVSGKQLYTTNQNLSTTNQNLADTNKSLAETNKNVSATTTNITNLQNTVNNISSGSAGLVQQSAAGKDITVAKDLDGDAVDFSGKKLSDSTTFSRKLTGVAEGTLSATSTDAVSGKQLYATNQNVSKLSANVTDVSDSVTNIKNTMNTIVNGGGLKYFHANSTLDDAQAMGLESIAFGGAAVAAGMNSMAMGGNARAMAGNAVALGAGSVADRANTVSVGSAGKERQITNVAAGTADTDAVNVAQLKAAGIINGSGRTNATVTYGTNADGSADYGNVTLGGGNAPAGTAIHNVAAGTAETDAVNVRQMNAAIASVQKVSNTNDPMFAADGDRAVKRASAKGTHATAMGAAASAGGDQSVATGHNAQSGGDSSVAMGANAKATANHAVAVGSGSVANRANTMSVGSAGNERQITNVAAGVQGTDAVNVSQLSQAVYAAVGDLPAGTTARQYTDEQIGMVRQGINQVARGAYSGIAAATALTMIPDVDQGKSIAIGIGSATYKGYQAVALGASARISHNLKAKMGVGYSSEGTTVGMGASYQW
ncbi:YadA-like family protein (plasmid) [Ralstonia pseudosolanacearum]|uniref:YadA-like family protein n=1 Tax=Ralstonia pseudosolanacearum TaxID=1310165 RepID=UPI0024CC40B9|nr:YadA-like family protein [Ralstonia solanacearum]